MERGKESEGEREKGQAIKLSKRETLFNYCGGFLEAAFYKILGLCSTTDQVSFSALRKVMENLAKSSGAMTEEQLDFLLLNLHHLSKYRAEQIFPSVNEYEILQIVCGNIRDFHRLKMNGCVEHEIIENVLPHFQLMAERIGHFLLDDDELIDRDYRLSKPAHLLLNIIPIQLEVMHMCHKNLKSSTSAEVGRFIEHLSETSPDILREYLIHLQVHMVNVITTSTSEARNIHVMIEFLLIILTNMPKEFIHHDKLFDLLAHVGELIREVSTLVRYLEENSRNEESTIDHATLDLMENIELMKEDLKHVYLKSPDSSQLYFPMSDGSLFMHLLLSHLNDLLNSNAYSVALIKEEIKLVKEDLEFIRSFLINVEQEFYKDLRARVLDLAFEAKDVIDSIIVRDNGLLHLIFSLPFVIRKIKLTKEEVPNLLDKIQKNKGLIIVKSPTKHVERKSLTTGQTIVGFKEETDLIISKLTSGPKMLDVISITGTPGLGKTTLAYKVYHDKSVCSHFDIRSWCTVDKKYDEKKLLEDIFNQVTGSASKYRDNIDVANELRKHLFGKRFLIVLDDLWDIAAWDELTRPFPEAKKGSRIILTTRDKKVALYAQCHSVPLDLRLLRPEESWELIEKRVFENGSCPDELLDVGKEIVQNCKGLPLVVNLMAGVLAEKEKKRTVWLQVRNNLHSFILQNEVDVMKVIALSYDLLPDHLKLCLIHLASFPKDKAITVFTLKLLWPAEGFLEQREMKSVEETVEVYLDILISSSLVISFNERGKHPTCQIHDLVHDFCSIKAREEKLFDLITSSAPSSSSSLDLMPRQMAIEYNKDRFWDSNFVLFDPKKRRHSGKHLYSLTITEDELHDSLLDICHLRHLRLLRLLLLHQSFIKVNDSLLNEICTLVHLRFLYIRTEVKFLPSCFSNLWNLETLWVNNDGPPLVLLPTIWNLVKLRVLAIYDCSFFDLDTDEPISITEDSKLEKLRILWGLKLSYSKDTEDLFKRFPNLQELSFNLKESWDCSTERYWFPKLDVLNVLESLKLTFESSNDSAPSVATNRLWDFFLPLSLKLLMLLKFPLTSDSLSTIGRLPELEELYLVDTIMEGEEWNLGEEDTFQNLKCLTLQRVTLAKWEVREESFPALEKLRPWECPKLEEIPPSFGDICSLKSIELWRSPQLEASALKIKQEVEDMTGEDRIQVVVDGIQVVVE